MQAVSECFQGEGVKRLSVCSVCSVCSVSSSSSSRDSCELRVSCHIRRRLGIAADASGLAGRANGSYTLSIVVLVAER